ncbi:AAA family ATPase [Aphanothece sacrum]|uniref:AAA domain protein n=1 Tax=Aphanothece sacrum FPU1 TaxID=1920663 RepID=A0A401IL24_APHSA|nr:AAA family ATPase [Aphanothece sacrum]GBF81950.1 AAA domain protein [Aphanothece sacrum FPU1]GBF83579.1 AAA domain protein [Aphanothece sacrum FPU3]
MKTSLMTSSESLRLITSEIGFNPLNNSPKDWQSITEYPLLILVGLTGVGKTTTTDALLNSELNFSLLPNRRILTDQVIFPTITNSKDPILCRIQRLELTKQYQQLYPPGMAYILSQLQVKKPLNNSLLIFDGLRGENEVTYAAKMLPNAQFIVLEASNHIRLQRLINRQDTFDYINNYRSESLPNINHKTDLDIPEFYKLLTPIQQQKWLTLINQGKIDIKELKDKVKIIAKEQQNYDIVTSRNSLLKIAPERTLAVNTALYSSQQIAQMIIRKMKTIILKQRITA